MRFWDVRSKTCVSRLDVGGEAFTLSWSADGSTMIVGKKVITQRYHGTDLIFPMGKAANMQHATRMTP